MHIFESEKSLASIITDKITASLCLPIRVTEDKPEDLIKSLAKIENSGCDSKFSEALAKVAEIQHPDLTYGSALLVSTVMNRNDDVFLPEEVWKARYTPVNTPFNDDHIEVDIIGHIIAARPLDAKGEEIPDDTTETPDYLDIEVDWVLYSSIFPAIAKEIIEKAPKGEKFVSMECKFANFDYALFDGTGQAKIVERNEDTAFLTKYLRAYGGTGKFQDYKIGRVLRNMRFVGMGNVDVPANPTSEYTRIGSVSLVSQGNFDKVESNTKVVLYVTKGKIMTIETLEQAKELITELTSKVEASEAVKAELVEVKATLQTVTSEKEAIANELSAEKSKVEIAEQKLTEARASLETATSELNQVKADLKTKAEALEKIENDAKVLSRVNKLKELGIEVNDEKKQKIAGMSDDAFASVVEFTESVSKKPATNDTQNTTVDATTVATVEQEASKALENAEENSTASPETTAGDTEPEVNKVQKTAAKLIEAVRGSRTPKTKVNK